jgi:hypothetical protein
LGQLMPGLTRCAHAGFDQVRAGFEGAWMADGRSGPDIEAPRVQARQGCGLPRLQTRV